MQVRIFQPTKTAMQSGRANARGWVLEYEMSTPRRPDPLMGWSSAGDTLNQVRLSFKSRDDAVAFAERRGWPYAVQEPTLRRVRPKSYADNFRASRP